MKTSFITALGCMVIILVAVSCGDNSERAKPSNAEPTVSKKEPASYDPSRGEGKYDASNVQAGALDAAMADQGKAISATKCNSCHKMTDERLVGPGWKGVTERRSLHWLMNFITNPDPMIEKDPELQAQLEICLVRMPNQNLNDSEARSIVEFMRSNDGVK